MCTMNIIGQKKLLERINKLIETNNLPRYIIIQGSTGSGKHLIADYISRKLNALLVPSDISVNEVREVIDLSYSLTEPTVYLWADCQKMSIGAKNAVLKVTEEPPQSAYFIMTVDSTSNLLSTLVSRGYVFDILPYTANELLEFAIHNYPNMNDKLRNLVVDLSDTVGDVINIAKTDVEQLDKIVSVLCNNVGNVNLANELKISTFLKFKADDNDNTKINPLLFMKASMVRLSDLMLETNDMIYAHLIKVTSMYMSDMRISSINKQSVIDNWIIELHTTVTGGII